jgi:hypothetical protein
MQVLGDLFLVGHFLAVVAIRVMQDFEAVVRCWPTAGKHRWQTLRNHYSAPHTLMSKPLPWS